MATYDPPKLPLTWTQVVNRPLAALEPVPEPLSLPALPSPPRQPEAPFSDLYTLSTHILPAAYPRVTLDFPIPLQAPEGIDKAERKKYLNQLGREMIQRKTDQSLAYTSENKLAGGSSKVLWNCVNRYVKKSLGSNKGLTLFFAHANGFPKEIWEPTLQNLLADPATPAIDEIWTWEAVQHGDAGLINKDNLSGLFDWMDNSRDILNFLINYLPTSATSSVLPTHLSELPGTEAESRKVHGYRNRTLVAVGHSFGGCTSALVAINYPALFSALILADPVIILPDYTRTMDSMLPLVRGALARREHWSSREEAYRQFIAVPFFASWDPAVLEIYINHGLSDDPSGGVRLKMSGAQEAIVFVESYLAFEVWQQIGKLDDRVKLRWVVPGKTNAGIGGEVMMRSKVYLRPNNASHIRLAKAGHLIPQEAPREFAQDLTNFLQRNYATRDTKL